MKQELLALGICALSWGLARGVGNAGSPVSALQAGELDRKALGAPQGAPGRIVTAALLPEELLVDVLEPSQWVGISHIVDWPSSSTASARFPRDAQRTSGSPEAILSLGPDLVILSDYNLPATESLLQNANVRVWRVRAVSTLPELFAEWRRLGVIVEREERVERLARAAEARYEKLWARVPPASALFLQGSYAYARGALQVDCPERAGFRNLLSGDVRGWTPKLSEEELSTLKPDFVFLGASVSTAREMARGEPLPNLPVGAFSNPSARVFLVPEALMGSISQFTLDACELYVHLALGETP